MFDAYFPRFFCLKFVILLNKKHLKNIKNYSFEVTIVLEIGCLNEG